MRLWDYPSAAILTMILLTVSQRLHETDWAPGLGIALILTIFGVLLGFALGYSRFHRWGVYGLTLGFSITLLPLVTGSVFYHTISWLERLVSIGGRLGNSLFLFINSRPVPDTILFVIFSGLGFWVISILAGFALTRYGEYISAVVPVGVVLFIIQMYDSHLGDNMITLAVFAFLCLLLLGRLTYVHRRALWKAQRVSMSTEAGEDINLAIPIAALVLIFLAWNMPAAGRPGDAFRSAWESITGPLQKTRSNLANAIAGLHGNDQGGLAEFYGDTLPLGLHASVDNRVYLQIRVPKDDEKARYYWRVRTYDQYLDNSWHNALTFSKPFTPDQPPLRLADVHGLSREFIFVSTRVNLAILITPAHPTWVSRPSVLGFTPSTENNIDPLIFRADPPILVGEQYIVRANIYNPTVSQLKQAGTIYPAWVKDHYLQLPPDLPAEIGELASRITNGKESPYEKATAITDYLRANITYSVTIDSPPNSTDPLTWFLFNTRTGFCNYYATAEVIMLRSIGVPARMVVGYAQGRYDSSGVYNIYGKDAHAWPEVYFPDLGWVEFEPTSSQPPLTRLAGDTIPARQQPVPLEDTGKGDIRKPTIPVESPGRGSQSGALLNFLLQMLLFFELLMGIIIEISTAYSNGLLDKIPWPWPQIFPKPLPILLVDAYGRYSVNPPDWLRRWANFEKLKPIERSFSVVYRSLRWLGADPFPAQTPAEAAAALIARLPEVAEETGTLLREYQYALYSRNIYNMIIARHAAMTIRRHALRTTLQLRVKTFRASFLHLFSRKQK